MALRSHVMINLHYDANIVKCIYCDTDVGTYAGSNVLLRKFRIVTHYYEWVRKNCKMPNHVHSYDFSIRQTKGRHGDSIPKIYQKEGDCDKPSPFFSSLKRDRYGRGYSKGVIEVALCHDEVVI